MDMTLLGILLASLAAAVLALIMVYLLVLIRPTRKTGQSDALKCDYAHRGLHGNGVPENSLAAFEAACEAGYGIELDVQLSRDGVVMVFHDYTLKRMTGVEKRLSELDAEALGALSLDETGETIPTLASVLSLVDGRVPLLIELKGEDVSTALCERLEAQLRGYKGVFCMESFNPLLIGNMKTRFPDVFCGLLYTNVCRDKKKRSALNILLTAMALNVVAKPDFIAYNQEDRKSLPVRIATGLYRTPRFVWTVKTQAQLDTAHANGEFPIFESIS